MPSPAEVKAAAARLRAALAEPFVVERGAAAIAEAAHSDAPTTTVLARELGWSTRLLDASLKALYAPFAHLEDLTAIAATLRPRHELIGLIMPGSIPGAGLHELVLTLLAGAGAIVKTASTEPLFFATFAKRLAAIDPQFGERITVFNWAREQAELTLAMRQSCDRLIVLGDDATVSALSPVKSPADCGARTGFIGFGGRVSGVVLTAAACNASTVHDVARDAALFEQRGCLSPHHVFVGDATGDAARTFAEALAESLSELTAGPLPPPTRLALEDGAAIRSLRERARWRAIGGRDVLLLEGPFPGYTVIYDHDADFSVSPGFRTVFVSPFSSPEDLARRFKNVAGRVEAFAFKCDAATDQPKYVDRIRAVLEEVGATYICEPGRMQSPPVDWPHGGGAFIRTLRQAR
jgi:hypothetical protein